MTRLKGGYHGLPGGHVEAGEMPEDAVVREVIEELGLEHHQVPTLTRHDFWRDGPDGRILLFYTATLDTDVKITPQLAELIGADWVTREQLTRGDVSSSTYAPYLIEFLS